MKIILAKTAGFCMGVRRALDKLLKEANDPASPCPVCTDGPLIHNKQVLELLEKKGIRTVKDLGPDAAPGTLVIRAHGVTPRHREEMERISKKVVNATCPHVVRVQKLIDKFTGRGYDAVIVGDAGHAEVNGLLGFSRDHGHVVGGPEEVAGLPAMDKVLVVAQTTQSHKVFSDTVEEIHKLYPDAEVHETICSSTSERQQEVLQLCEQVDAMIVVGGKHSANTCRLADISRQTGIPTFHVETDEDLEVAPITQFECVGVTAGASTPQWMIKRVLDKLQRGGARHTRRIMYFFQTILGALIHSCVFVGLGAICLSYVNGHLLSRAPGLHLQFTLIAAAGLFVMSLHLLNQIMNIEAISLNEPDKGRFYNKHFKLMLALGFLGLAGAGILGFVTSPLCGAFIIAGGVCGLLYRAPVPGRLAQTLKFRRLEQIPGSKEIFVSLAWTFVSTILPFMAHGFVSENIPVVATVAGISFLLVFVRSIVLDMRDIEGDQVVGSETVPVTLGARKTRRLLLLAVLVLFVLVVKVLAFDRLYMYGIAMLAASIYCVFYILLYNGKKLPSDEIGEAMVDANFILPAVVLSLLDLVKAWH